VSRSKQWWTLGGFTFIAVALLGLNIGLGNTPVLGLDLKGGLSVIYRTAEPATEEELLVVRDLMRGQLEDFGITEPDVRVEGENIVVDLPGVTDQEAAFDALQVSGIVSLRPVIQCQAAVIDGDGSVATTPTTLEPGPIAPPVSLTVPSASVAPATANSTTDTADTDTADTDTATTVTATTDGASGFARPDTHTDLPTYDRVAAAATTVPDEPATASTVATTVGTTVASTSPDETVTTEAVPGTVPGTVPIVPISDVPAAVPTDTGQTVLPYPNQSQQCLVGPSGGSGEVFEQGSAKAEISQENGAWLVTVGLRPEGQAVWNGLATQCFNRSSTCPSQQLAIVLDDVIQSAPVVQTTNFGDSVQITGSSGEDETRALARVLNRGAFPVAVEPQRVETVSATVGEDSLNAAIIAGVIGVLLTMGLMILHYRKLSIVLVIGMIVWAAVVFSLAALVSRATNYALTLAGATGIIVSVGVTIDSYVVYFERLRDEMRHGRTLRNAAPSAFTATWRTIFAANIVTLMAALILFTLSVGSVKGFALYLGLTTIADVLVHLFFTRPAVLILADSRWYNGAKRNTTAAAGVAS
jgi:preprotein translocase subunit SecD